MNILSTSSHKEKGRIGAVISYCQCQVFGLGSEFVDIHYFILNSLVKGRRAIPEPVMMVGPEAMVMVGPFPYI